MAHSVVRGSHPLDGERLTTSPERLDVIFSKPTRIIKASIIHDEGAPLTLEPSTKEPSQKVSFSPVPTEPGMYVIKWRAISQDGHVLKGQIGFSIGETK